MSLQQYILCVFFLTQQIIVSSLNQKNVLLNFLVIHVLFWVLQGKLVKYWFKHNLYIF